MGSYIPWSRATVITDFVMPGLRGHGYCTAAGTIPRHWSIVDAPKRRTEPAFSDAQQQRQPLMIVVDDDVATLDLLCEIAAEAGWFALGYTRLASFRAALEQERPSLLIIDDDLPDGRGGEVARELRDDPRTAKVPALVCTAAHPLRQSEIGAWAPVIAKPFDLREIEAVLDQAARARRTRSFGRSIGRAG
jgi:CheY-like chemotaxis protein